MTEPRHHVVLIGIDAYDGGGSLTGCVNDIDAVQRILLDRVGIAPEQITRLASPRTGAAHDTRVAEQLPTLANIRAALQRLGGEDVQDGDRVLVYYSGHGTQCIVTDDAQRSFAREALLPKDKVLGPERRFLFDWEINQLIASIAARTSRVTVILDCCSSAGATRAIPDEHSSDRFFPTPEPVRGVTPGAGNGIATALGKVDACQVIVACREDERARESAAADGVTQGELTRALVAQLETIASAQIVDLCWSRIWRPLEAAVRAANPAQSPWLYGRFGRRLFGFGADEDGDRGYAVVRVGDQYRFDAGRMHGVTEDAVIAIYDAAPATFPALGTPEDLAARRGCVRIVEADSASSVGSALAPFDMPAAPRGRLVEAGRIARLRVRLVPDDAALAAALGGSKLLSLVTEGEEVALVRRADGTRALVDDVHGDGTGDAPVLAAILAGGNDVAARVLEHYLAYITPIRMARACVDLPGALRISVLDCGDLVLAGAVAQDPTLSVVTEVKSGGRVCFAVDNAASEPLSITLLDCAASGRVEILGEARLPAGTRHVFWCASTLGVPFQPTLPPGRALGIDRLVAIGTSSSSASLGDLASDATFEQLVSGPATRGDDATDRSAPPALDRWTSATLAVRIRA